MPLELGGISRSRDVLAEGRALYLAHCAVCHSLDYIVMNSPFLTRAQWQAEVTKMIEVFKAPIDPADATRITDYVVTNYGR